MVGLASHLCFSWIGFNPSEDGEFLATSRRLLEGKVPYRDFIWIYPPLSSVLHAPVVALGGDLTFWLSRLFVWLELSAIAWCWTVIVGRMLQLRLSVVERSLMALIAVAMSIRTFQLMAWHTIDALLVASFGIMLRVAAPQRLGTVSYLVGSSAYLFKQSFLPLPLLLLVGLGDWRRPARIVAAALPGAAFVAFLAATHAAADALVQLTARADIVSMGLTRFVATWQVPCGILLGLGSLRVVSGPPLVRRWAEGQRALGAFLLLIPVVATAIVVLEWTPLSGVAYLGLFGFVLGAFLAIKASSLGEMGVLGALVLFVAWCTSLSYGENNPGFAGGALSLFLIGCFKVLFADSAPASRTAWRVALFSLSMLVVPIVAVARYTRPDGDRRAAELVYALDGVLPGAARIYTNANTYRYLADLSSAMKRTAGRYTVLPDNNAVWVAGAQSNPLCIDWPETLGGDVNRLDDLAASPLLARVLGDIDRQKGQLAVIVQKVEAGPVFLRFEPLRHRSTFGAAVVEHVRRTLSKIDETEFFEVYR